MAHTHRHRAWTQLAANFLRLKVLLRGPRNERHACGGRAELANGKDSSIVGHNCAAIETLDQSLGNYTSYLDLNIIYRFAIKSSNQHNMSLEAKFMNKYLKDHIRPSFPGNA